MRGYLKDNTQACMAFENMMILDQHVNTDTVFFNRSS